MSSILLLNLIISFIAVGLIWTIQLVHYPTMRFISEKKFTDFHNFHSKRISILAIPIMSIELLTSFLLFYQNYHLDSYIFATNFTLVILIWISTFLIQVPMHNILSLSKNDKVLNRLILSNWIRTILWSVRSILMTFYLAHTFKLI